MIIESMEWSVHVQDDDIINDEEMISVRRKISYMSGAVLELTGPSPLPF